MTRYASASWILAIVCACSGAIGDAGGEGREPRPRPPSDPGIEDPSLPPPADPLARCDASEVGPPLLRRLTRGEIERTLRDVFPEATDWAGPRLGADPRERGFSNDASTLRVSAQAAREMQETAEELATLVTAPGRIGARWPCASSGGRACAEAVVDDLGPRLFRRALTTDERARYVGHLEGVAARSDFATGAKWALVALLQSPRFLYRHELGEGEGERRLRGHELATALAYGFGGTAPDAALLARAEAGELDVPEARVAEARRLLDTPGGRAVTLAFFREQLGFADVATKTKENLGPAFTDVRDRMVEETRRFLEEVLYTRRGGLDELLTAPFTVVDASLASFYGFPAPAGEWGVVERPAGRGVGLLAQGSLLAGFANVTASSPTKRGLLVYEALLCQHPTPPPPGVSTDISGAEGNTTRERIERVHTAHEVCASCHDHFDPIGFGFEHFDEAGRWRADEAGFAIEAHGSVPLTGDRFDGAEELAEVLAGSEHVGVCVSGVLTSYVFGGGGGQVCLGETSRARLLAGEPLLDVIAALAAEPHFTRRVGPR